jgi:hypothetical protein
VRIIVYDMEGLHDFQDEQVMPLLALLELGARYDREHPGAFDRMVELARPDDLAILVYTSGTTGPPKGAMLSHRNILFQLGYSDFITQLGEGDQQLSFLPLCHIAERTFTVFNPLRTGATVNFAESIDTVPDNIREVGPALFFAVPRIWEKFYSAVVLRMREATLLGKLAYRWAIGVGMRVAEQKIAGQGARGWAPARPRHRALPRARQLAALDGFAPGARRRHRSRADRAGADQVVHGARHRHARGVRPDGELRARDGHARRSHQARHRRRGAPRHAGAHVPRGGDPPEGPARLPGLSEPAR